MTMYGLNQPDDERDPTTGALTNDKVGGALGEIPQTSAPPASGGNAPVPGAPLSGNQAMNAQAGGAEPLPSAGPDMTKDRGTTENVVMTQAQSDPDKVLKLAQTSASGLATARKGDNPELLIGQGKEMEKTLAAQGAASGPAIEQMKDQYDKGVDHAVVDGTLTKKQGEKKKLAFRNIFNTIKPEEMSLFLIDFGLRTMMAGETMGSMGAIGAGGMGAMGALEGRRKEAAALTTEADRYEREFGLDERRVAAQEMSAEAQMKRASAVGAGYQGKDKFLLDFYRSQGRSDEWIAQKLAGAGSYEEIYDSVAESVEKAYASAAEDPPIGTSTIGAIPVTVGGKETYLHKLTAKERAQLAREITDERMRARRSGSAFNRAQTGALGDQ